MAYISGNFKWVGNGSGLNLACVFEIILHINPSFAHLPDSKFKIA